MIFFMQYTSENENAQPVSQQEIGEWIHQITETVVIEECAQGLHTEEYCNILQP